MDEPTFLVCYGYGTGGIWRYVRARNPKQIYDAYPELVVVTTRPEWLSDEIDRELRALELDINGQPEGLLKALLRERERDNHAVGDERPVFTVGVGNVVNGRGRWIFLFAHTMIEVRQRYPELQFVRGRPDWVQEQLNDGRMENAAYDIDGAPVGLLADIVEKRHGNLEDPS